MAALGISGLYKNGDVKAKIDRVTLCQGLLVFQRILQWNLLAMQ